MSSASTSSPTETVTDTESTASETETEYETATEEDPPSTIPIGPWHSYEAPTPYQAFLEDFAEHYPNPTPHSDEAEDSHDSVPEDIPASSTPLLPDTCRTACIHPVGTHPGYFNPDREPEHFIYDWDRNDWYDRIHRTWIQHHPFEFEVANRGYQEEVVTHQGVQVEPEVVSRGVQTHLVAFRTGEDVDELTRNLPEDFWETPNSILAETDSHSSSANDDHRSPELH